MELHMKLKYGDDCLLLDLPDEVPRQVLKGARTETIFNPEEVVAESLRNPIGASPLREIVQAGETVCLLVNDSTRLARSDLFLPVLIEELSQSGIDKDNIFIQFTNGTHRPMDQKEMISIVGQETAGMVAMYNHDSRDVDELFFLGYTSFDTPVYVNKRVMQADRRILTGSVVHHFFAGFGGGRKALVPGVAGWDTICSNHSLMFDQNARTGVLKGNPVHEDLVEGALMAGGEFLLNTVLNEDKDIIGIFAGDILMAHYAACEMAEKINGYKLEQLADVVIASCGGYPKDINLYQAHKTLDNALAAMKPGGQLIFLAQCRDGVGSALYEEWASKYTDLASLESALKANFVLGGHKAYKVAKLLQKGKVHLVSDFDPDTARLFGFVPAVSLEQAVEDVYSGSRNLLTYIIPQGSILVPHYTG